MGWFTFIEGWDGPSLANIILAILVAVGPIFGYWLGRRNIKKDRQIDRDEKIAQNIVAIMNEPELEHFIGYLRGAHRYADRDFAKFIALYEALKLHSNSFHDPCLERARIDLHLSTQNLGNFILQRFFYVSDHTFALQPEHNPDRTDLHDASDPKTSLYLKWVAELDDLSSTAFESYCRFIKAIKQLRL